MKVPFVKMYGAGNDFAVFDARKHPVQLDAARIRALSDRRTGIGFDQLIVLEPSAEADVFMRIFNADGGETGACGNATRCIGQLIMNERGAEKATIRTRADLLSAARAGEGRVSVDMGIPRTGWQEIPLSRECDTLHVELGVPEWGQAVCVSMGNPHAVFFLPEIDTADLARLGPELERHALFPERANISIAQIMNEGAIHLRVWERGAGETLACGTAACATLVAAVRRGICGPKAEIQLPGGMLTVEWRTESDAHVIMTGPVATAYDGMVEI